MHPRVDKAEQTVREKRDTSERWPHRVKSPACIRTSPSGTPLDMCDVMLWVSLIQTILNLSSGAGSFGFLVLNRITVEDVTRFDQKAVGSSAIGSGVNSRAADIFSKSSDSSQPLQACTALHNFMGVHCKLYLKMRSMKCSFYRGSKFKWFIRISMARIIRSFAHLGFWISDERVETDLVFEEFKWNDTSRLQKMQNTQFTNAIKSNVVKESKCCVINKMHPVKSTERCATYVSQPFSSGWRPPSWLMYPHGINNKSNSCVILVMSLQSTVPKCCKCYAYFISCDAEK